jgi:hypothetical protein
VTPLVTTPPTIPPSPVPGSRGLGLLKKFSVIPGYNLGKYVNMFDSGR